MKKHASERGQTLPIIAVAVLVLVAIAGFAADVGYHQYEQRVQQTATDSAALAAAAEFKLGDWAKAGKTDATTNGYTQGSNGVTLVNIAHPLSPDPYASDPNALEADIQATYPTFFERVFGFNGVRVSTKAVAIADSPANWCMLALSTNGTSTINAHSVIDAPNCDIAINSSHLSIGGQSTITTANPIQYSGNLTGSGTSNFNPGAPVSALPASDPCPQITVCLYTSQNLPTTSSCAQGNFSGSGSMLSGTYCNVTWKGNTTLSGTYVITGNLTANNVNISGDGVTIILTSSNCPNINNATLNLSAPTSGPYTGMLFYDAACAGPLTMNSGSANPGLDGMIYVPNAKLTMNAGATAAVMLITGTLTMNSANTTFTPNPFSQVLHPRLVE